MKQFIAILTLTLFIFGSVSAEEITVGVKTSKPFVYMEDGKWTGIEIDLLNELAEGGDFTYKIVDLKTIPALLDASASGEVDMSMSAISMTADREKTVDFSHSYFKTPLGILSKDSSSSISHVFKVVQDVLGIFIGLILLMYVMGYIISRADKGGDIEGIHEGAWCALVTFSTTGYGDEVPKTNRGKVVVSFWIITSLFLISLFTGYVSSAMTVSRLNESTTTLADLYNADVVAVSGTTGAMKLVALGISHKTVDTLNEAVSEFNSGNADAVVYDKAILDYLTLDQKGVSVHEINNSDEYYAIAISPKSSAIMQRVNLGILKVLSTPEWKAAKVKYFGAE